MQRITKNVAKLLILLENLPISERYGSVLAAKMKKDYTYVNRLLDRLIANKWILGEKIRTKKFYFITPNAPLEECKRFLTAQPQAEDEKQVRL